ncbi:putative leucine-rich repeat-containing, plant-type, leucine-rich repeat domain superfamily [Helianthus debilis subsp. tardiflorus]
MASIHLQAFSLVYFLLLTCTTSFLNHDDEECLALFQFKQTILRHNYDSAAAGFLNGSGSDCCLWEGVVCSSNKGHVIELDWSQSSLSGLINSNSTLFKLLHLQFLSLAANSFEDVFPLWLGTHPKLQVLILRSNKFYGAIQGLSSSQFLRLRIIDISNNGFSGQLPHK